MAAGRGQSLCFELAWSLVSFPTRLGLLPLPFLVGCGGLVDWGPAPGTEDVPLGPDVPLEDKELTWMRQFGSAGQDKASAVAFTGSGSVLLAGWTSLGSETASETLGKTDSFVRRYDDEGEVEWARQFGTTDSDGVYAAASVGEELLVAGYCRGSLPGQESLGESDAYVSRLTVDGTVAWMRQFGTPGYDVAYAIAGMDSGEFLVTGYVAQTLPNQTSAGSEDAFWARFDGQGQLVSAAQFGSTGHDIAFAVCVSEDGGWAVAGATAGSLAGGTHLGKDDGFVQRYAADGKLAWSRQFGGPSKDAVTSVACLPSGAVLLGGYFFAEFDGAPALGSYDAFLRKYDESGQLVYSRVMGTEDADYVYAIAVDAHGRAFLAGATEGLMTEPSGGGRADSFVLTLDDAGLELAAWQFGSSEFGEARAIALSKSGRLAVAGYAEGALPGQIASGAVDAYAALLD